MPSAQEKKRRDQKRRNGKRSSESHRKELERHRRNYRAKRQRESLEAIDARAAAGATSEKGLQALPPFQKSQNNPSLFR